MEWLSVEWLDMEWLSVEWLSVVWPSVVWMSWVGIGGAHYGVVMCDVHPSPSPGQVCQLRVVG